MRISGQATEEVQRHLQRKGNLDGPLHRGGIASGFVLCDGRLVDANGFAQLFLCQTSACSGDAQPLTKNFFDIHAVTP